MSLDRQLLNHGHVHRLIVAIEIGGWEVREEHDSAVLRRIHRDDWHRVERDLQLFELKADALKIEGWSEL